MARPAADLSYEALDDFVLELLDAAQITSPPIDAFLIAEALAVPIARDSRQAGRARLARLRIPATLAGQSCILLNDDPRPERRQWAVAHEIGEHLAPELFHRTGCEANEDLGVRESLANVFAGRLLLPRTWLACQGGFCDWDLLALKEVFSTASHELIARRMLDFAAPVIVTIFDLGKATFRGANFSARRPALSKQERTCQARAHESGKVASLALVEASIRAWPIHEPEWKREILRTDVHAIFD